MLSGVRSVFSICQLGDPLFLELLCNCTLLPMLLSTGMPDPLSCRSLISCHPSWRAVCEAATGNPVQALPRHGMSSDSIGMKTSDRPVPEYGAPPNIGRRDSGVVHLPKISFSQEKPLLTVSVVGGPNPATESSGPLQLPAGSMAPPKCRHAGSNGGYSEPGSYQPRA